MRKESLPPVNSKQDILIMTSKFDVMRTLKTHPHLWDDEINQHLINLARQYLIDNFGAEDIHFDPLPRDLIEGGTEE